LSHIVFRAIEAMSDSVREIYRDRMSNEIAFGKGWVSGKKGRVRM